MPCLFAFMAGFPSPGLGVPVDGPPEFLHAAFNGGWLWPILGIIFLPFTTIMYVILWTPGIGLAAWDWFWLFMAVILDVMHYTSTAYCQPRPDPRLQRPGWQAAHVGCRLQSEENDVARCERFGMFGQIGLSKHPFISSETLDQNDCLRKGNIQ